MSAADHDLSTTEFDRLRRALERMERQGAVVLLGAKSPDTVWPEAAKKGATPLTDIVVIYNDQLHAAFPQGPTSRLSAPLGVCYNGSGDRISESLEEEGLRVVWPGRDDEPVMVVPQTLN